MKNRNGFTLTEVLVVIAIIAVIVVIAVPSIIVVNKNMNERMYNNKLDLIEAAAELYGTNNPDAFNATNEEYVTVGQLIASGFLEPDTTKNDSNCDSDEGCLIDPRCSDDDTIGCKRSMNDIQILITKETAGVSAIIGGEKCDDSNPSKKCKGGTLVQQVCEKFNSGKFVGKYGTQSDDYCGCTMVDGVPTGIYKATKNENGQLVLTTTPVNACIVSGDENNNYLEYDGTLWRVMGVYDLYNNGNKLVAKIITNDTVDAN